MTDPARQSLAKAIEAEKAAVERVAKLEAAYESAEEEIVPVGDSLHEAEAALERAKEGEQTRLVNAFVSGALIESPVVNLEAEVEKARRRSELFRQQRQALWQEIYRSRAAIERARHEVRKALAAVVEASPETAGLFTELDKAWAHLRGVRAAFAAITTRGLFSQPFLDRAHVRLSVEPDELPRDEAPAARWSEALDRLMTDPDAPLPSDSK